MLSDGQLTRLALQGMRTAGDRDTLMATPAMHLRFPAVLLVSLLSVIGVEGQEFRAPLPLDTTQVLGCWRFDGTGFDAHTLPGIRLSVMATSRPPATHPLLVAPLEATPDFPVDRDFSTWALDSQGTLAARWGNDSLYFAFTGSFAGNMLTGWLALRSTVVEGSPGWQVRAHRTACPQ